MDRKCDVETGNAAQAKACGRSFQQSRRAAILLIAGALLFAGAAHAQLGLAITEMMSSALKTNGQTISTNNSDFWELTNFGANTVDLSAYQFSDSKGAARVLVQNPPLFIHSRESIIFVRDNITKDEAQFRAWWGPCVGPNVQVRFFKRPGFSSNGDGIRVYSPDGKLVDSVDFGPAIRGTSFVYDTNTGAFAALSILSQGGTCHAATAEDIASPGVTTGPIPLNIVRHPTNLAVCLGVDATFRVAAVGMPRPRYQWFFNDSAISGANQASFTVPGVTTDNIGRYHVVVTNGFATLQSSRAALDVETNPSAPSFVTAPADVTAVTNRTARFSVSVCAFPAANYQWLSNGVPVPGANSRTLLVPNCTFAMSGSQFCVRVQNAVGTRTACARLYVTTKPDLRITEVQAYPVTGCDDHHDWFEVTNFGTNAVDLLGYRFSDEFSLDGAVVVTQSMVIRPAESAVFVKNPVADIFLDWWGAGQLPPGLRIFPYAGFSLSKAGDTLYLWNAAAEDRNELIESISFAANLLGVSQRFDYDLAPLGGDSIVGEFGAFRALQCGDIGSPGYIANPPPRFLSITRDDAGARLRWRAMEGKTYQVQYSTTLRTNDWRPLGDTVATNSLPTANDPGATNARQRFYRVLELTP